MIKSKFKEVEISSVLNLSNENSKGWRNGTCPFCKKSKHLGINFNIGIYKCFKCTPDNTRLYYLLKFIDRLDLIASSKIVELGNSLKDALLDTINEKPQSFVSLERNIPIGYERIYSHNYLENRGFDPRIFINHSIGVSDLAPKINKNYLIFLVKNGLGGIEYVSRSILSREECKSKNLLRWINSTGDFSNLLYGIEKVSTQKTAIVVEGITSVFGVESKLNLFDNKDIATLGSFGKKLSTNQVLLMKERGIRKVILLYDPDALKEEEKTAFLYENYFDIRIGVLLKDDPARISKQELLLTLKNVQSPMDFYRRVLKTRIK